MTSGNHITIPAGAQVEIIHSKFDSTEGVLKYQVRYKDRILWIQSNFVKLNLPQPESRLPVCTTCYNS
jgi:hypothetical protein